MVDGIDGLLAATTQRLATVGQRNAVIASRMLGILVVIFSFGLGSAELAGTDLTRVAFPLGVALFATVVGIRIWARSYSLSDDSGSLIAEKAES